MAWRIEGTYFESCSCELIRPCIAGFGLPARFQSGTHHALAGFFRRTRRRPPR